MRSFVNLCQTPQEQQRVAILSGINRYRIDARPKRPEQADKKRSSHPGLAERECNEANHQ